MSLIRIAAAFLPLLLAAADPPMPRLTVEATDGGSALRVANLAAQPLTAWLVELVGYPGSSFAYYHEGIGGRAVAPGAEDRIAITNMTVGAAPEYVKMQAALFADGSSAGPPEKVAQLIALRRTRLDTTRELIARLEKGKAAGQTALAAAIEEWAASIPEPTKRERGTPAAVARSLQRDLIRTAAANLTKSGVAEVLAALNAAARALAASKPAL